MVTSLGEIAAATRGRILSGDPARLPAGVSIDSRTIAAGQVFFAIEGPVHDGHDHVEQAVARGAEAVVVSRGAVAEALSGRCAAVLVGDTTRALQDLASHVRRSSGATVAAVTGSVGKTTTKELAGLLIGADRKVHVSPGNLNNHYGVPLALLALPPDAACCVLELGISTPGEMDRLVEIAAPDLGLVTLVASAHVGNFTSFAQLADEKMKLPAGSRAAVLNADDPEQWRRRSRVTGRTIPFGTVAEARDGARLISSRSMGLLGSQLTIEWEGRRFEVECPLPGSHQARNLLAAAALALAVGVPPEAIARAAPGARPGRHRGEVLQAGGATVVDDCYNANPKAMRAALDLLAEIPAEGRRIFVAGDMLELGGSAADEHRRLGELAADRKVDLLIGVGADAALAVEAARARGIDAEHFSDAAAAGERLVAIVRRGDVVLVKGSRGMALERAVERLCGKAVA